MKEERIIETENLRNYIKKLEIATFAVCHMCLLLEIYRCLPIDL